MATQAAPNGVRWVDGMDDSQKYAFDLVRISFAPRASQRAKNEVRGALRGAAQLTQMTATTTMLRPGRLHRPPGPTD